MSGIIANDESIPEEFEEKELKPAKPFEIEKSPFGKECSVFWPVASLDSNGFWKGKPKFSKRIFASINDAKKEIKKYLTKNI